VTKEQRVKLRRMKNEQRYCAGFGNPIIRAEDRDRKFEAEKRAEKYQAFIRKHFGDAPKASSFEVVK